jgi:hypothetical protein
MRIWKAGGRGGPAPGVRQRGVQIERAWVGDIFCGCRTGALTSALMFTDLTSPLETHKADNTCPRGPCYCPRSPSTHPTFVRSPQTLLNLQQTVCEQLKVQSQNDTAKLAEAKGLVYLKVMSSRGGDDMEKGKGLSFRGDRCQGGGVPRKHVMSRVWVLSGLYVRFKSCHMGVEQWMKGSNERTCFVVMCMRGGAEPLGHLGGGARQLRCDGSRQHPRSNWHTDCCHLATPDFAVACLVHLCSVLGCHLSAHVLGLSPF